MQVLLTGAYIPLHVGKGDQQRSQEILTTEDTRAQTEKQTLREVLEEWLKKKREERQPLSRLQGQILFPFYSFLERGFRLPMTKLVPESTHHVSHANPGVVTQFHGLGKIQISELFFQPNYTEHVDRLDFKSGEAVADLLN